MLLIYLLCHQVRILTHTAWILDSIPSSLLPVMDLVDFDDALQGRRNRHYYKHLGLHRYLVFFRLSRRAEDLLLRWLLAGYDREVGEYEMNWLNGSLVCGGLLQIVKGALLMSEVEERIWRSE